MPTVPKLNPWKVPARFPKMSYPSCQQRYRQCGKRDSVGLTVINGMTAPPAQAQKVLIARKIMSFLVEYRNSVLKVTLTGGMSSCLLTISRSSSGRCAYASSPSRISRVFTIFESSFRSCWSSPLDDDPEDGRFAAIILASDLGWRSSFSFSASSSSFASTSLTIAAASPAPGLSMASKDTFQGGGVKMRDDGDR
jgi:hypothetical protein